MLIGAFGALLAGGFALRQLAIGGPSATPRAAPPAEAAPAPTTSRDPEATTTGESSPPQPAAPATKPKPEGKPTIGMLPKLFGLPSGGPDYPRGPDGKLIAVISLNELSDAEFLLHDKVKECLAAHGKPTLNGDIFINFTVARKRGKSGKFTTEVESAELSDDSTIKDQPELTDCIVKTTFALKMAARDNPVSVWAQRKLTLTNGLLEWSWIRNFTATPP